MGHHKKTHRIQTELTAHLDMLSRYIGFGAMGGHPYGGYATIQGHLEMIDGADPRKQ